MSQVPSATCREGKNQQCDQSTPSDRRSPRSLRATALIAALLIVAACDSSVVPTNPSPSAASAAAVRGGPGVALHHPVRPALAGIEPRCVCPATGRRRPRCARRHRVRPAPGPVASRGRRFLGQVPAAAALRDAAAGPGGTGRGQRLPVGPGRARRRDARRRRGRRLGRDRRSRRHAMGRAVRGAAGGPRRRRGVGQLASPERRRRRARGVRAQRVRRRLYKRLLADPQAELKGKGVAMSPTSVALALAMARAGANGSTASQMDRVLHANGWNDLGDGLGSLQQILNDHNATWKDDEGTQPLAVAQRRQPGVRPGRLADRTGLSPADRSGVRRRHRPRRLHA